MNILEREAAHQRAKYLKYKNINKSFAKKNTSKEDDTSNRNYLSRSEVYNSRDEYEKASITYDSESADDEKISNSSISSEGNI